MARKSITDEAQKNVVTRSRRRCCLCFWLDGLDEVQRGQIAHLDQNNENSDEDNLVFLCLKHHDEYDGKTSQSKGLRQDEVRHWRDLLYQELEHRFRSARAFACELSIVHVAVFSGFDDGFSVRLRLKNVGKAAIKSPVVTIRLLRHMFVRHKQDEARPSNGVLGQIYTLPDPYAMFEKREDIFEPNGRVALKEFAAAAVLLPDHSWTFDGFWFDSAVCRSGTEIDLEYCVGAEDMLTVKDTISLVVPRFDELTQQDDQA